MKSVLRWLPALLIAAILAPTAANAKNIRNAFGWDGTFCGYRIGRASQCARLQEDCQTDCEEATDSALNPSPEETETEASDTSDTAAGEKPGSDPTDFSLCVPSPSCEASVCGCDEQCADTNACLPESTAQPQKTSCPSPGAGDASESPSPTSKPAATTAPEKENTGSIKTGAVEQLLEWINEDRIRYGLQPLKLNAKLCALAEKKSIDFIENKYFAHTSPVYGSAAEMVKAAGIRYTACAENIAHYGTLEKAHAALMSSSGHRRNLLGSYTQVGLGVAYDAQGFPYLTEIFLR